MKGVKLKQVLAILLTALCASAQLSPQSVKPPEPESPAAVLLNDSYAIASHFDVDERVPYLVNLTEVAVDIAPPEKVKIWGRKLFADSFQLSNPQMRIAEEKNALVPLSKIDAQLAMDLFPKVEDPPAGNLSEDVRANAATHIFPNYWHLNGIKGLSTIQQMARHIGESGEYPYRAMGLILAELAKSKENPESRQKVGEILRDALEFYQLGESRFRNPNIEFLDLLEMGKPFSSDV